MSPYTPGSSSGHGCVAVPLLVGGGVQAEVGAQVDDAGAGVQQALGDGGRLPVRRADERHIHVLDLALPAEREPRTHPRQVPADGLAGEGLRAHVREHHGRVPEQQLGQQGSGVAAAADDTGGGGAGGGRPGLGGGRGLHAGWVSCGHSGTRRDGREDRTERAPATGVRGAGRGWLPRSGAPAGRRASCTSGTEDAARPGPHGGGRSKVLLCVAA